MLALACAINHEASSVPSILARLTDAALKPLHLCAHFRPTPTYLRHFRFLRLRFNGSHFSTMPCSVFLHGHDLTTRKVSSRSLPHHTRVGKATNCHSCLCLVGAGLGIRQGPPSIPQVLHSLAADTSKREAAAPASHFPLMANVPYAKDGLTPTEGAGFKGVFFNGFCIEWGNHRLAKRAALKVYLWPLLHSYTDVHRFGGFMCASPSS